MGRRCSTRRAPGFQRSRAARPGELRGHRAADRRRHRLREGARPVAEADRLSRADRQRRGGARLSGLSVRGPPARVRERRLQRSHDRVPGDHRDHPLGPGRGRDPDGERRARRRGVGDDPAAVARAARRGRSARDRHGVLLLSPPGGGRPPRSARPGGGDPRHAGRLDQVGRAKGTRRRGAARDGDASGARVEVPRGRGPALAARLRARGAARDPGDRGDVLSLWRYRERLPVEALVTMGEGDTPLIPSPQLSSLSGADVFLKLEGANPTGSFKDRGMTVAVSAAIGEGAEAVICASTGNTAASAAAYAARAGLRGAVIVPEGKIATGKLAQALMHGARVIALRGNFDEALALVRELATRHPIALVNSVNDFRIEGQKTGAFEVCDELGEPPDVLCIPVGNAGNVTSWWKGFQEYGVAPRMHGYQAEGAAPLLHGAPVEHPETVASAIRIGNPARWEDAMNAFTASRGEVRAVSDAEILDAYSLLGAREGVFCEPASAASVAGLLKNGADGRVVCVLTGHGLKDPQTAMNRAASVVPCEPHIESVERAVLG